MSVMQRNAAGGWSDPGTMTGRPMGPIQPVDPAQLQRQAVVDQLGAPQPMATPAMPGSDPFARGGAVKPLPTGPGAAGKLTNVGVSTGLSVASKLAGSTAAGAAMGGGISFGTDLAAKKLRTKEEMPTFGGSNSEYLDDLGRRFQGTGGGIASNTVKYAGYGANPGLVAATGGLSVLGGAAFGAAKGAITKHAPSAYTDFKVEDAANAIKAEYKKELGRDASDEEVMTHLKNQGFDPTGGDRWVGEKNLNATMDAIRSSPEAQAFKTRGAVMDQLGTGAPVPGVPPGVDPATLRHATAPVPAPPGAAPTVDTTVPAGATRETPGGHGGVTGGADVLGAGYKQPPPGDVGPTVTFADGSVMPLTNAQNEATLAAQPANTQHWAGVGGAPNIGQESATTREAVAGASDSSAWNTDGYTAPAYVPPNAGPVPPGWDATKWNDPNHQTPKYGVGRILSQFPPTVDGLKSAMADIEKAYPGTTFNGKDTLTIPGVGPVDVLQSAGTGGVAWRWGPKDEAGGGSPAQSAADPTQVDAARTTATAGDGGEGDMMAKLRARLQEIMAGSPNREALLAQMGPGSNG